MNSQNEEFSTVFSDPAEHKDKPTRDGKKGHIYKLGAIIAAVAVLAGGTIAVSKLVPDKEQNTAPTVNTITVLNLKSEDFKTVEITNTNGTFKLYSETNEETSSADSSQGTTTVTSWYVDGSGKEETDKTAVGEKAAAAAAIEANREVTTKTAQECGLEAPSCTVKVTTKDDGEFQIYIGDESPDNSGKYLKLSTNDKIYIVSDDKAAVFDFALSDLAASAES